MAKKEIEIEVGSWPFRELSCQLEHLVGVIREGAVVLGEDSGVPCVHRHGDQCHCLAFEDAVGLCGDPPPGVKGDIKLLL